MPKETFFNLPDEKRKNIIDIAAREFAQKEYQEVSVSRLVELAGIAKGSFYQYFEDKKDLFLYLVQLSGEEKMHYLESKKQPPDPNMGVFAYLEWLVETSTDLQFRNPDLLKVGFRALYGDIPFRDDSLEQLKKTSQGFFMTLVDMGKRNGDIDSNIDTQIAAFMIENFILSMADYIGKKIDFDYKFVENPDRESETFKKVRYVFDQSVGILKNGLSAKESKND